MKFNGGDGNGQIFPVIKGGTSEIWILANKNDDAVLHLIDVDDVFVVMQTGTKPAVVNFDPGTYDVSGNDFTSAPFPVVIIRMHKSESERFKTLPLEVVNNFLSKLGTQMKLGAKDFPGFDQWYDLNGKRTKFKIAGFPLTKTSLLIGDKANDN